MEDEKEFETLIIRFLTNELSTEEETGFFEQLDLDPEKRQLFENYQSLWRLSIINDGPVIDTTFELDILKNRIGNYSAKVIPISLPEDNAQLVVNADSKISKINRLIRAISVAASILLIFVLVIEFFKTEPKEKSKTLVDNEAVDLANNIHREINESGKPKFISLADGSKVLLYEKSEISYQRIFGLSRDILLKGKARFSVVKDKSKAFIVIGGGLQTKAIGTEFTVTAFENSDNTLVQLHEGKLLISAAGGFEKLKKSYVLLAGDELLFNKKTFKVKIIHKTQKETTIKAAARNQDKPVLPQSKKDSWYMFNNQSLGQVFDHLGSIYNVNISYRKNDVKNRRFIGMFNQTDSLENILTQIATVNDLKVKKNENGFLIYK